MLVSFVKISIRSVSRREIRKSVSSYHSSISFSLYYANRNIYRNCFIDDIGTLNLLPQVQINKNITLVQYIAIQNLGHKIQIQNMFQIYLLGSQKLIVITAWNLGKSFHKLNS